MAIQASKILAGPISPADPTTLVTSLSQPDDEAISINGRIYAIWGIGKKDMCRYGRFYLQGELFYAAAVKPAPSEEVVFETIANKITSSMVESPLVTKQLVKILHQDTMHMVHISIFTKYALFDSKVFSPKDRAVSLSLNNVDEKFEIVYEILMNLKSINDPENIDLYTFMKAKVTISGTYEQLIGTAAEKAKIQFTIMVTEETSSEKTARAAKYGSFFSNSSIRKSYIA